jgi:hypothetical protein
MTEASYSSLVSEAGGLALALETAINDTDIDDVPVLIGSQLGELEALTIRLKQTDRAPARLQAAHQALVEGLEMFQGDLMNVSDEASRAASGAWNDGGSRVRYELSLSHGLATIKSALGQLNHAGFTDSGS